MDEALVKTVAATTSNPPFIITGSGTDPQPWSLRVLDPSRKADPTHEPTVISIGDDPEGIFQASPPTPVDLAVVLKQMRRLGATKPAISASLAWNQPEMIAISALDSELSRFQKVVTAASLSRGATGTNLPASFRRGSLSYSQVIGDITGIPIINRLALPGVILGGENATSGFSILETEPDGSPMLARWDDRVVLSFPLVAVIISRGIPFEDVVVDLGNYIRIGKKGPYIPIDHTGRISSASGKLSSHVALRAEALEEIDQPLGNSSNKPILLRDDQSNAESATRDFSSKVALLVADISSGAGMSGETIFRRMPPRWELTSLGLLVILIASFSRLNHFARAIAYGIFAAGLLITHLMTASLISIWLPTLAGLAATLAAFLISRIFFQESTHALIQEDKSPRQPHETASSDDENHLYR